MAKFEIYRQIDVSLTRRQYPIIFCTHGLNESALLHQFVHGSQLLIVTNEIVAPLYLNDIQKIFSSIQCDVVVLPDGERYKNQQSLFTIYDSLIQNKHHRDTTVFALGGGVIGDLTGFAASTYQRGVSCVQIPTSLLAQIDSSVGGKTAINHPLGKNLIGSFYQPQAVIIDLNTLKTLPDREFRAGLAEMIKYSLLAGNEFLSHLQSSLRQGISAKTEELPELIAKCCQIKASLVEVDEKDQGQRALLNLGHTFAHALEAITEYKRWLHGEAVAIGLYCAALLSYNLGFLEASVVTLVEKMLCDAGLPHKIPQDIDLKLLRTLMSFDKKIKNNRLHFVLMHQPGVCFLEEKITEQILYETLTGAVEGG